MTPVVTEAAVTVINCTKAPGIVSAGPGHLARWLREVEDRPELVNTAADAVPARSI